MLPRVWSSYVNISFYIKAFIDFKVDQQIGDKVVLKLKFELFCLWLKFKVSI